METRNTPEQIELRKRQNTLIIVGVGTIFFGVWSIIKTVGLFYFDKTRRLAVLKGAVEASGAVWEDRYYTVAVILAVVILTWDLIFRSFIGWAAISAGKGKRRSILYIIIASLMVWSSIWTITGLSADYVDLLVHITAQTPEESWNEPTLSAIIIEITSLIMLVEMIHASIRVKKLTNENGKHKKRGKDGEHGR